MRPTSIYVCLRDGWEQCYKDVDAFAIRDGMLQLFQNVGTCNGIKRPLLVIAAFPVDFVHHFVEKIIEEGSTEVAPRSEPEGVSELQV